MANSKGKRLKQAEAAGSKPTGRTHLLGFFAAGAVLTVFGAELTRVWRLGMLPQSRTEVDPATEGKEIGRRRRSVMVLREGYAVSRPTENAPFNMLASFTVAFATTRAITWTIREKGGLGPIKDVVVGARPIHHFLHGGIIALAAGGAAIGSKKPELDKSLAFPFGVGVALVLDESALLLELDDVYWTEEGVLSVQIAFAAIAMLSALAYLIRMLRHSEGGDTEADWRITAKPWNDLQAIPGAPGIPGIGL